MPIPPPLVCVSAPALVNRGVSVKTVACGTSHCVATSSENVLYSWGSNKYGCLGADLDAEFSTIPRRVRAFDVMIAGVGRGSPRSVTCGNDFTVVACFPYVGPTEEELIELEAEKLHEVQKVRRCGPACLFLCAQRACTVWWRCWAHLQRSVRGGGTLFSALFHLSMVCMRALRCYQVAIVEAEKELKRLADDEEKRTELRARAGFGVLAAKPKCGVQCVVACLRAGVGGCASVCVFARVCEWLLGVWLCARCVQTRAHAICAPTHCCAPCAC